MSTNSPYSAPQSSIASEQEEYYQPNVFSFSGRIGRLRYLAYNFIWNLIAFGIIVVVGVVGAILAAISDALTVVAIIGAIIAYGVMIVAGFAMAVRRLNDMNTSGWLSLLMLVPLVNFIFALVLIFAPGTKATNNYGPQPSENTAGVYIAALVVPFGGVAVLGMLAAIALPAYQDYTLRAEVSAALIEANPVKNKVEIYAQDNGEFPVQNRDINHDWRSDAPNVQSIDVATGGVITLVIESDNLAVQGKSIVFSPSANNGFIEWDCTGGDLAAKYRPSMCRPF